jgi:hypothetical protein
MESCQVLYEAPREIAYLAGRNVDTCLVLDYRADLMALPVPEKTFQPHPNHDIIADNA